LQGKRVIIFPNPFTEGGDIKHFTHEVTGEIPTWVFWLTVQLQPHGHTSPDMSSFNSGMVLDPDVSTFGLLLL